MIFRAIAFTAIPTIVELTMVSVILMKTFSPLVSLLVLLTFGAYVAFSIGMTQVGVGWCVGDCVGGVYVYWCGVVCWWGVCVLVGCCNSGGCVACML